MSVITKDIAVQILNNVIDNNVGLTKTLRTFGYLPSMFFYFVNQHQDIYDLYVHAQKVRSEMFVEEIIDIADSEEDYGRARNRIDARRWYASKMQPGKYGDRVDINVNQTVSITSALDEARKRISTSEASKLSEDTIEGELIAPKVPELDIFK